MLFEFCHIWVCWLIYARSVLFKTWEQDLDRRVITISYHHLQSENSQLSEISPSQFIFYFVWVRTQPSFCTYKLPISLYCTPGILVINLNFEVKSWICSDFQYWTGRSFTQILFLLYKFFLFLPSENIMVILVAIVISDSLTFVVKPYTMITWIATTKSSCTA